MKTDPLPRAVMLLNASLATNSFRGNQGRQWKSQGPRNQFFNGPPTGKKTPLYGVLISMAGDEGLERALQ